MKLLGGLQYVETTLVGGALGCAKSVGVDGRRKQVVEVAKLLGDLQ